MVFLTLPFKALLAIVALALPAHIEAHPVSADQSLVATDVASTGTWAHHQARSVSNLNLKSRYFDFIFPPGRGKGDVSGPFIFKGHSTPFDFDKEGQHGGEGSEGGESHGGSEGEGGGGSDSGKGGSSHGSGEEDSQGHGEGSSGSEGSEVGTAKYGGGGDTPSY
ncbi:hypothetical protein [Sporisorium scitamineum]|uniref:Uncharacterized protein n=1 Tax=Sporisorium scitamineum TaxID=49012 RepID=A0A0F7S9T0_9BASI|nr:hypothetical protein [Sporisorium scitamineum]